jgi:hypothetical protein
MPQTINQKTVNTFVKGLVTEAGELTFPEDASIDERNCVLERDGSRRRRLAVELENSNVDSSFTTTRTEVFTSSIWYNVGGIAGKNWLVLQEGDRIYFYNTVEEPYSASELTGLSITQADGSTGSSYVDLGNSDLDPSNSVEVVDNKIETTSIDGSLIVVSPAIEPFYLEYISDSSIVVNKITPKVRDFKWQGDIDEYSEEEPNTSVTDARKYDSANGGWTGTKGVAANASYSSTAWPPLTHPWYSGKNSDGDFDKSEWEKIFSGSSILGNGHFILDFFNKERSVSFNADVEEQTDTLGDSLDTVESSRFKSVASFSGRVFYAGLQSPENAGKILFSRLVDDIDEVGRCYQQNDPSSESLSDLLDTDGGVITIKEAANIQKLAVVGTSLLVFAENGVWQISGVEGIFSPAAYSVNKVTSVGINGVKTYVEADGIPIWWSKNGIHTLVSDKVSGRLGEQNLSISTVQTFFDGIDGQAKLQCEAIFDKVNKRVYWFYPENSQSSADKNKKNKVLIMDLPVQAFYPWDISGSADDKQYIISAAYLDSFGSEFIDVDVTANDGTTLITDSSSDTIIVQRETQVATADAALALLVLDRTGGTNKVTIASFSSTTFKDWDSGGDYVSFAEAGYDFMGDLIRKKTAPYVQVYLRPTETGWTGNENDGYTPVRESSLKISTYWDFRKTVSSAAQEAYRLKYTPVVDPSDLTEWDYPDNIVTSRLKCRGSGRNMRLRFESTTGKDFVLLGFGVLQGVNRKY